MNVGLNGSNWSTELNSSEMDRPFSGGVISIETSGCFRRAMSSVMCNFAPRAAIQKPPSHQAACRLKGAFARPGRIGQFITQRSAFIAHHSALITPRFVSVESVTQRSSLITQRFRLHLPGHRSTFKLGCRASSHDRGCQPLLMQDEYKGLWREVQVHPQGGNVKSSAAACGLSARPRS